MIRKGLGGISKHHPLDRVGVTHGCCQSNWQIM